MKTPKEKKDLMRSKDDRSLSRLAPLGAAQAQPTDDGFGLYQLAFLSHTP